MDNFAGTVYETLSTTRVRFSTKPGGFVSSGELVEIGGGDRKQLGRITSIERRNYLIDQDGAVQLSSLYDGDPSIDTKTMGIRGDFRDHIVGEIEIIGRRGGNIFKRPRAPFNIGEKIFKANREFLEEQLRPDAQSIAIGTFRDNHEVKVHLNLNELISKHFCVLAMTGGGKSWTIAVIIEAIARKYDIPIVIFDPHGEYSSLCCARDDTPDAASVTGKIKIFVVAEKTIQKSSDELFKEKFNKQRDSERLCVNMADLETYQIIYLMQSMFELSEAQNRILQAGWSDITDDPAIKSTTDIEKIIKKLEEVASRVTKGDSAKNILNTKLRLLYHGAPFIRKYVDDPRADIKDIVKKGQVTVIDMSGMEVLYQQAFIAIISNKILRGRMRREIPPVLTIFEEAHRYIPSGAEFTASKPTIKRIAQEGRKFLMGMGIISQRPSRVDSDVLSQCNTQIIMRLTNPNDQKYVKQVSEHITDSDLEEIRTLAPGEAYLFGSAVPLSLPTQIEADRLALHGGYTPDIVDELQKF